MSSEALKEVLALENLLNE